MKRKMDFWFLLVILGLGVIFIIICLAQCRTSAAYPSYIVSAVKFVFGMVSGFTGILYFVIGVCGLIGISLSKLPRKRKG